MLGRQSRTKTLAYRSPILLPHQLQYFLSKFHFMSMVRGPTHTAMLQPCGALLPISPPQSLRLPVAHLQELAGIYDPQMLAPHTRQHFHPSQLLLAHLCPPQSDLLSEVLLGDISILDKRGHYYRGATEVGQQNQQKWAATATEQQIGHPDCAITARSRENTLTGIALSCAGSAARCFHSRERQDREMQSQRINRLDRKVRTAHTCVSSRRG